MQTSLELSSGDRIPQVGLGCWKIDQSVTANVVSTALKIGYRHLDCACDYGNEAQVGEGIQQAFNSGDCQRDELWVTSKLWNTYHAKEHVRPALERSLSDLKLDYLDLYLVHFPIAQRFVPFEERYSPGWHFDPEAENPHMEFAPVPLHETWGAMEELVRAGLVRNIGVCNYNTALLRDLLTYAEIRPSMLQIESHPYLTQEKLVRLCRQEQIAVTAFSPLGALSYVALGMARKDESLLTQPVVKRLAERHRKTPAQVLLRWGVQRGNAIVPKSSNEQRLEENLSIFDFALTDEEMKSISDLNCNRRYNDPGLFCEQAFGTFCPIYE